MSPLVAAVLENTDKAFCLRILKKLDPKVLEALVIEALNEETTGAKLVPYQKLHEKFRITPASAELIHQTIKENIVEHGPTFCVKWIRDYLWCEMQVARDIFNYVKLYEEE